MTQSKTTKTREKVHPFFKDSVIYLKVVEPSCSWMRDYGWIPAAHLSVTGTQPWPLPNIYPGGLKMGTAISWGKMSCIGWTVSYQSVIAGCGLRLVTLQ